MLVPVTSVSYIKLEPQRGAVISSILINQYVHLTGRTKPVGFVELSEKSVPRVFIYLHISFPHLTNKLLKT